jgi:ApbE superfamily uncharacterized protein (UPF0280 family)
MKTDLVFFTVNVKETELFIHACRNLTRKALKATLKYRADIEGYIEKYPLFLSSLGPLPVHDDAPEIVKEMLLAAKEVSVGPMAAVAGAIAEYVGKDLLTSSPEVIANNGGDVFIKIKRKMSIQILAGNSPLTGKIALEIEPEETPLGICTSSGTVGHSLSFGKTDAVTALAPSASLADASATAIGNVIKDTADIPRGIDFAQRINGLKGVVIIKDDRMETWGEVKIVPISSRRGEAIFASMPS